MDSHGPGGRRPPEGPRASAPGAEGLQTRLNALQARRTSWGLHAIDVNLALGDLVEIVGRQSAAWTARNRKSAG